MGARRFKQNPKTGRMEGAYGGPGETPPTAAPDFPGSSADATGKTRKTPRLSPARRLVAWVRKKAIVSEWPAPTLPQDGTQLTRLDSQRYMLRQWWWAGVKSRREIELFRTVGVTRPITALKWKNLGIDGEEAWLYHRALVVTPDRAAAVRAEGISGQECYYYYQAGIRTLNEMTEWRRYGVSGREAYLARKARVGGLTQTLAWKKNGGVEEAQRAHRAQMQDSPSSLFREDAGQDGHAGGIGQMLNGAKDDGARKPLPSDEPVFFDDQSRRWYEAGLSSTSSYTPAGIADPAEAATWRESGVDSSEARRYIADPGSGGGDRT